MQRNFWQNKKVLITGAGGFVGSHLSLYLSKRGAIVVGISRHSNGNNFRKVDVTDKKKLEQVFRHNSFFACFHLAGDALVEQGKDAPFQTLQNNIFGALNILEICRLYNVSRIIIASTVHVYGDAQLPYREDNPSRPSRPYETSKTCVDIIAQSFADTFRLPVLIPRFVNIYGPGDLHFTRVIPKTIRSILTGKNPTLWGGKAIREFLYVDDVVAAYDLLAQMSDPQIEKNRIYNFGSTQSISIENLIDKIISIVGTYVSIKKVSQKRSDELPEDRVSWTKAKQVLGWKPTVDLEKGLDKTVSWYRNYFVLRKDR